MNVRQNEIHSEKPQPEEGVADGERLDNAQNESSRWATMRLKARIFMWAAIACVPLGIFLLLVEVNGNDSAYNIYGWLIMTAGLYCAALWAVFTPQKGNSGRTIVLTWILFFIAFLATIPIVLWGIAIVAFSSAAC